MRAIDHSRYLPKYAQVIQYITERIENGAYPSEGQIPAEHALAQELGVSRITVTNAIGRMVHEGTLYRIQGKGTFVSAQKKVEHRLTALVSFTEDMVSRGFKPRSVIVSFERTVPPPKVMEKLPLGEGETVWKLVRVRFADEEPIALQTAYLPTSLFPDLQAEQLKGGSLYKALVDRYGIEMNEAEETYRVGVIRSEREAALLNVAGEAPALFCLRVCALKDGTNFEYTESILRGDRYVLSVKMKLQ